MRKANNRYPLLLSTRKGHVEKRYYRCGTWPAEDQGLVLPPPPPSLPKPTSISQRSIPLLSLCCLYFLSTAECLFFFFYQRSVGRPPSSSTCDYCCRRLSPSGSACGYRPVALPSELDNKANSSVCAVARSALCAPLKRESNTARYDNVTIQSTDQSEASSTGIYFMTVRRRRVASLFDRGS